MTLFRRITSLRRVLMKKVLCYGVAVLAVLALTSHVFARHGCGHIG